MLQSELNINYYITLVFFVHFSEIGNLLLSRKWPSAALRCTSSPSPSEQNNAATLHLLPRKSEQNNSKCLTLLHIHTTATPSAHAISASIFTFCRINNTLPAMQQQPRRPRPFYVPPYRRYDAGHNNEFAHSRPPLGQSRGGHGRGRNRDGVGYRGRGGFTGRCDVPYGQNPTLERTHDPFNELEVVPCS